MPAELLLALMQRARGCLQKHASFEDSEMTQWVRVLSDRSTQICIFKLRLLCAHANSICSPAIPYSIGSQEDRWGLLVTRLIPSLVRDPVSKKQSGE